MTLDSRFCHPNYLICKQFFKLMGGTFRVFDPAGQLVLFADMKAFKLKEDIRLYTEEEKTNEIINIKARHLIDISAAYDVVDSTTGEKIGALKRMGLKSMLKDEWVVMDALDQEIGRISEDSWLLALVRRYVTNLIPQKYHCEAKGNEVCTFQQNFNPFVIKLAVDLKPAADGLLDRRLILAAGIMLCAVEGKQG